MDKIRSIAIPLIAVCAYVVAAVCFFTDRATLGIVFMCCGSAFIAISSRQVNKKSDSDDADENQR